MGFYWALVETVILRRIFFSGVYFDRSFVSGLNGRTIFYALTAVILATFLTCGFAAARRIKRVKPDFFDNRVIVIVAAFAVWANLSLVSGYALNKHLGLPGGRHTLFAAAVTLPVAAGIALVVLGLKRVLKRSRKLSSVAPTLFKIFLIAGVIAGAASFAYERHRMYSRPAPADLPDVILITLDAWRADKFNAELTPGLFDFARENGLVFKEARAPSSWTLPSFASLFTGSYNATSVSGVEAWSERRPTWAEVMRDRGYDTIAVLSNPHLDIVRFLSRGFSEFHYVGHRPSLSRIHYYDTVAYFASRGRFCRPEKPGDTTRRLTEKTLKLLSRRGRRPKFIWVHILDPHYPYQPLPRVLAERAPHLQGKSEFGTNRRLLVRENTEIIAGLYENEIVSTDLLLTPLLRELSRRPRTVVIISSDHGEEFYEHGDTRHGKTIYAEVCRVPLIIAPPKGDREPSAPGEITAPVSLIDVAPSILSYLGISPPPTMEGRDDLLTHSLPESKDVFTSLPLREAVHAAVVSGERKVLTRIYDDRVEAEYYDLKSDPAEREPLPSDAEGERLKRRVVDWAATKYASPENREGGDLPLGGRAELRALGYM